MSLMLLVVLRANARRWNVVCNRYRENGNIHRGGPVRAVRITPNLPVADIGEANGFYQEFLGLQTEEFNLGWVARYTSPESGANVQLVTADATAAADSVMSVHADDVDAAYAEAQRRGYVIVHPLTTETWGVRRFLVRAPDGNVINIVQHRD
ncbi:VOC family protein [Cumulibacter soli]|uniref:VOC family protein n=1 Tax=Cumulibacter soli TaxID=2546344 RepID=UPI001FB915FC|nr:VOC family protein [Cumulibacter soli]